MGAVAHRVERATFGELYFPLSVAWLFWLTCGDDPLLFVIPILMLTLADAAAAVVGARYGLTPYIGAGKSLEGSAAFAVVAFSASRCRCSRGVTSVALNRHSSPRRSRCS